MDHKRIIAVLDILAVAALVSLLIFAFSSPPRGGGDAVARQIETVRR